MADEVHALREVRVVDPFGPDGPGRGPQAAGQHGEERRFPRPVAAA